MSIKIKVFKNVSNLANPCDLECRGKQVEVVADRRQPVALFSTNFLNQSAAVTLVTLPPPGG